jgi:hypothetical protein
VNNHCVALCLCGVEGFKLAANMLLKDGDLRRNPMIRREKCAPFIRK